MSKSHIILIVLIGMAIMYLAATAGNYSRYSNFAEAISATGTKEFQVIGQLAQKESMVYAPEKDPNYFSFFMEDKEGQVKQVVYNGRKPQDFERSEDIVLTGKMNGDVFAASKILLKCPSKYNDGKIETKEFKAVGAS